ncbi:MAG TPA: undecaprenyl-phosphate glucose phosphotransferase [Geobacteraceae bacterium]
MIRKHQRFFNSILVLLDSAMLLVAYGTAFYFKSETAALSDSQSLYLKSLIWIIPLLMTCYYLFDCYSPMRVRQFRKEALTILRAHILGVTFVQGIFYISKMYLFSREVLVVFSILSFLLLLMERYLVRLSLRQLRRHGYNLKHLLVVGTGPEAIDFSRKVRKHRDFGYSIIGFLGDADQILSGEIHSRPVLGGIERLGELLAAGMVDEVIAALPHSSGQRYPGLVDQCEHFGVRLRIIPDYRSYLPCRPVVEDFDGIPLLNVRNIPLDDPFNRWMKRFFDIFVALTVIILALPVLIAIAIGIKLTSPGPVLFCQERIGLGNRPFRMLKFRTMRVSDERTASSTWTTQDDDRKTKFGGFLRKSSLDELPQFINVLKGEMSVVGPRPERPFFVDKFRHTIPKYMVKHQVKPGITGWAQVHGWRGDTSITKRIECDIYYIEHWDIILDVKIMFMTVFKGLVNKNAY